jgi:hypothetical protein
MAILGFGKKRKVSGKKNKFVGKKMILSVPVKDLEGDPVHKKVDCFLIGDTENATNIPGIMVGVFNVKIEDIESRSSEWKGEHHTLYKKIERYLKKLVAQGKVKSKMHGKSRVYWWAKKISPLPPFSSLPNSPKFSTAPSNPLPPLPPMPEVPKRKIKKKN